MFRRINNISEMNYFGPRMHFTVGRVHYPPGGTFGPRVQRNYQLVWINSGSAQIVDDQDTTAVAGGELVLLIPGRTNHFRFAAAQSTDHGWCDLVDAGFDDSFAKRLTVLEHRRFASSARIADLAQLAALLKDDRRCGAPEIYQRVGAAIFLEFFAIAGLQSARMLPRTVEQALHRIESGFAEALDLTQIAAAAAVSKQHLNRLFRAHLGLPAIEHLWRVRTERAADLITGTGLSLEEIAARCGFQNGFHLSRRVKRRFGQAPAELRRIGWRAHGS